MIHVCLSEIKKISILLCLLVGVGCTNVNSAKYEQNTEAVQTRIETTYEQLPVIVCLNKLLPAKMLSLSDGSVRLIVKIQNSRASMRYSPNFQLSLLMRENAKRIFIEQFSMHLDSVPLENNQPMPQSFSFDLRDYRSLLITDDRLCVELNVALDEQSFQHATIPGAHGQDALAITLELR